MNTQFKKGVLELIVLLAVNKKDIYGYELVMEVSKVVDSSEPSDKKDKEVLPNDVVSKPNLGISPSKMIAEISMYALD